MKREWWIPLTGVAFVLLAIIAGLIAGEPKGADNPVEDVVTYYQDNKSEIEVASFVGGLAIVLFLFFAAYLRSVLHVAEGPGGFLSTLTLVGAAIIAVGIGIDMTIQFAIA